MVKEPGVTTHQSDVRSAMLARRTIPLLAAAMVLWASFPAAGLEEGSWQAGDPHASRLPGEVISNPPPPSLQRGSQGPAVAELQERLAAAGFFPGQHDGVFGRATRGAVYAFQKVYGLERTGILRPEDWSLLDRDIEGPGPGPEADRVEVDLKLQVLFLIEGEQVAGVFPISSGNGETYRNGRGTMIHAITPEGRFTFRRTRDGWWKSYLGSLYRPFYFHGGYAIHGSNSVPPMPASHGCVRVELADMDYLATRLHIGMPIYVYGNRVDRADLIAPTALAPSAPDPISSDLLASLLPQSAEGPGKAMVKLSDVS